jgi:hypothetical protein
LIIGGGEKTAKGRAASTHRGWRAVGWFGLLLAVIGFADLSLYLIPPRFGVAEWEFATLTAVFSALPLSTIGIAGMVGALLVNQTRGGLIAMGVALLVLAAAVGLGYLVFLLNLPLALNAATGPQGPAIYRSIARATIMAGGFGLAYLVTGITLLRSLPERNSA